jgi:hypothetical protein
MRKSRPCSYCRRWFVPDRRVGARQRACTSPGCQQKRRAATQASWRKRHPDYAAAYRIQQRRQDERPEPPSPGSPLDVLPWDVAQDDFKPAGAAFLASLGQVLVRHAKDQIDRQVGFGIEETGRHASRAGKDEMAL